MTLASDQATRLASKATPGWWDQRIKVEIRYAVHQARTSRDPAAEWERLEQRLILLCHRHEHRNPLPAKDIA